MKRTALATITGLVLGLALVFGSFGDMLIVALFGAIGYGAPDPRRRYRRAGMAGPRPPQ